MKKEFAVLLVGATQGTEEELTLHEDYSGRSMFGRTTEGVTGSLKSLFFAIAMVAGDFAASDEDYEEFAMVMQSVRSDSMGLDTIFY